jgi:hypothetical protein
MARLDTTLASDWKLISRMRVKKLRACKFDEEMLSQSGNEMKFPLELTISGCLWLV